MVGQTNFNDSGDPEPQKPPVCAWCGEPAYKDFAVQPATWGYDKRTGIKIEKKPAVLAPTCRYHFNRFDSMQAEQVAAKAKAREEKKRLKREKGL